MNMIMRIKCRQAFARIAARRGMSVREYPDWHKRVLAIYERVWERRLK
jgi:hypothetical protein